MNYETLLISEEDGIVIVTLNREKALNALNQAMMSDLKRFFEEDRNIGIEIDGRSLLSNPFPSNR